jgi:hypothetical protein
VSSLMSISILPSPHLYNIYMIYNMCLLFLQILEQRIHISCRFLVAEVVGDGVASICRRVDEHSDQLHAVTGDVVRPVNANAFSPELLEDVELLLRLDPWRRV